MQPTETESGHKKQMIDHSKPDLPPEIIKEIVTCGTWATSADNCQPWKFTWNGKTLAIMADVERSGFFYDINNESTNMTLGAVAENIDIAASHFGFSTTINTFPQGEDKTPTIEISFTDKKLPENPLYQFIKKRVTNRKKYFKKKIEPEIYSQIQSVTTQTPGVESIWIDNPQTKKIMQKVIFDADRILFENEQLHQGLFKWIHLKKEEQGALDGMDLDILELEKFQQPFFPILGNWKVLSLLNHFGLSRIASLNSVQLLKSSPAYCLLTIDNTSAKNYIAGGRVMERIWIKANSLGLSVQPMAGSIFILNHLRHDGAVKFFDRHQEIIKKMLSSVNTVINDRAQIPVMFLRFGYSEPPTNRSRRRKVDNVLSLK